MMIPGLEKYLFRFVEDTEDEEDLLNERYRWLMNNFTENKDFRIIRVFDVPYVAADSEELADLLILMWNTRVPN